jgi:hypothetical protein
MSKKKLLKEISEEKRRKERIRIGKVLEPVYEEIRTESEEDEEP